MDISAEDLKKNIINVSTLLGRFDHDEQPNVWEMGESRYEPWSRTSPDPSYHERE